MLFCVFVYWYTLFNVVSCHFVIYCVVLSRSVFIVLFWIDLCNFMLFYDMLYYFVLFCINIRCVYVILWYDVLYCVDIYCGVFVFISCAVFFCVIIYWYKLFSIVSYNVVICCIIVCYYLLCCDMLYYHIF